MKFSLHELVQRTIEESEARVKTATADAVADGEERKPAKAEPSSKNTPPVNPNTAPDRNEASIEEKTSSADHIDTSFVLKLASAVDYCNDNFSKIAVGEVIPPRENDMSAKDTVGAGKGPSAMATNLEHPTPGLQNDQRGQATAQNVPPTTIGQAPASIPGNAAPATLIENDYDKPPGGTEDWTHKDVLKQAAAEFEFRKLAEELEKTALGKEEFESKFMHKMSPDKKKEFWGRFGKKKEGSASSPDLQSRILKIMNKVAADVPPDASASEENVPALPGPAASQAKLVGSNEAARDYTKRDAKAEPKERMGEVLSEPAQVKSTDPVLQNNLSETTEAGTKISSAEKPEKTLNKTAAAAGRALLQKIAEEGGPKAEELKKLLAKQKTSEGTGMGQQGAAAMPIGGGY